MRAGDKVTHQDFPGTAIVIRDPIESRGTSWLPCFVGVKGSITVVKAADARLKENASDREHEFYVRQWKAYPQSVKDSVASAIQALAEKMS